MFSIHKFIEIIHNFLLRPIYIESFGFDPSFSTSITDFKRLSDDYGDWFSNYICNGQCTWWHEEPLDLTVFDKIYYRHINFNHATNLFLQPWPNMSDVSGMCDWFQDVNFHILANSEKSQLKKNLLQDYKYYDWYFFFHGFAALDWFRDYKYLKLENHTVTKVFISLNHLITKKRSYRLSLLAHIIEKNLLNKGFVSCPLLDKNTVEIELLDPNSYISAESKKHVYENLLPTANRMVLDETLNYSTASSNIISPKFGQGALWHVVTETVFYEERLHLTEKIFKPIVSKRPFILLGAPGNLEYLRSYGFKTFDRWIDENYDNEKDPDLRMKLVIKELVKLCNLPHYKILEMHLEMQKILEFNYNHFYNDFKSIIINELITNFQKAIFLHNKDKSERFRIPEQFLNIDKAVKILNS